MYLFYFSVEVRVGALQQIQQIRRTGVQGDSMMHYLALHQHQHQQGEEQGGGMSDAEN